uniref:AlNc14C101G6044 protein n=1 Tax=Albugo laibachii Nc14 TaxID=890382 RepID=F0WHI1_9STRA|nr:AlNc14C101G6044 [Albugo laibachii Nc14]|eukprot:CCA20700.1 AlNc14C101G6044 [Albugo laibachii Nc14]
MRITTILLLFASSCVSKYSCEELSASNVAESSDLRKLSEMSTKTHGVKPEGNPKPRFRRLECDEDDDIDKNGKNAKNGKGKKKKTKKKKNTKSKDGKNKNNGDD